MRLLSPIAATRSGRACSVVTHSARMIFGMIARLWNQRNTDASIRESAWATLRCCVARHTQAGDALFLFNQLGCGGRSA